jgi:hypothetical protein
MLEVLHELADADYQQRLWRAEIPGKQGDWLEAFEVLSDDGSLRDALTDGPVFSAEIDDRLRTLLSLMDPIAAYPDLDELFASRAMAEIRLSASELIPLIRAWTH